MSGKVSEYARVAVPRGLVTTITLRVYYKDYQDAVSL